MNKLLNWMGKQDDISVSYDVIGKTPLLLSGKTDNDDVVPGSKEIGNDLTDIEWDHSIDKADKLDYELSIGCGILTGLLDTFFVGDFSLEN